ncbi:hypothetical protein K502DRAFT_323989 [Neoconidiobolus thromboides FSU 785]|nr:hypothetical protein K502DRAFT_323989 [Neoconidiobolus thromboides FSU 785]
MFQQNRNHRTLGSGYERRGLPSRDLNSTSRLNDSYVSELNWYNQAPEEEITIEEFETFAIDRLSVLKALEAANIRKKVGKELEEIFLRVSREHLPLAHISSTADNYKILRKDHISHFILRLVFCRSEDLRAWFVKYESVLFNLRYAQSLASTKAQFVAKLGYGYEKVSESEKQQLKLQLKAAKFGGFGNDFDREDFFKIPFEKVPELVSGRQVFIKNGFAYVPNEYSSSWIIGEFKNILRTGLLNLSKALPNIDEDERLLPILNALSTKSFSTYDPLKSQRKDVKISYNEIPNASKHFPLCMYSSYKGLTKNKHLKHGARMQFGLFLKGIGLPLEEALEFWRRSFSRMTDDEFKKGYAYNIRHNYGQEGNRKDYAPYG